VTLPTIPPFRRQEPQSGRGRARPVGFPWGLAALGAVVLMALTFTWGYVVADRQTLWGFVAAPLIIGALYPLLARLGRREPDFDLTNLMFTSLVLHLTASYFRLTNAADGSVYHSVGAELAKSFRRFELTPDLGRRFVGTGFLRYLSGMVQLVTFSDRFATFLVFATIAFLGTLLLYRAFLVGLPEGDRHRYALLIFLWPSLIFWPSSIGKEAWMLLAIGITACGAARMLRHLRGGFVLGALGLGAAAIVRPHVAFLLLAAMLVAYVVRQETHGDPLKIAGKIVGTAVLLIGAGLLSLQTTEFFQVEDLGADAVEQVGSATAEQTGQGGSEFAPSRVSTPLHYPVAAVTVLLRPFVFEASSAEAVMTALEGSFLVLCFAFSLPRLRKVPGMLRRAPYLSFSLAFIAGFIFAFSAIANFGILARQRTQVLPFVLVFLALPAVASAVRARRPRSSLPRPVPAP
jgi:hypothetical protein